MWRMDPEKELLLHAIAIMTSQVMIHPLLTYVWSKVFAKAMLLGRPDSRLLAGARHPANDNPRIYDDDF